MTAPRATLALLTLVTAAFAAGCERKKAEQGAQAQQAPPPPLVTVAKPTKRLVADHDEYVGRFVARDYVEIRARVSGYLVAIQFTDGQIVDKGDQLFIIDKRPFQAALEQARGAVQQATANVAYAESDLRRGQDLVRNSTISQQVFDQRTQALRVAQASLVAQQAAMRQAELDLQFTELTAPVSGRIGDRRVSTGNLVTGGTGGSTTLLATLASVDPIRFEFTINEASYLKYLNNPTAKESSNRGLQQPVKLKLIDEKDFLHEGHMDFVDNAIDPGSGTIRGRAVFPNPDGKLTPGMFGRIQIAPAPAAEALLVPDAAVGTEQIRKFVYTVDDANIASPKYITPGPLLGTLRVIESGLSADDTVIVNGTMRVRPGAKVTPQQATADAAEKLAGSN
jgi:RND family efflux transporter MFP subunit